MNKKWLLSRISILIFAGITLASIGFVGGWELNKASRDPSNFRGYCTREKGYQLTGPLLGCEVIQGTEFPELEPIKQQTEKIIDAEKKTGKIISVSVYFRLLNSGRWFAINGDALYSPASLLKVPLAMAYYKIAEDRPDILKKEIVYDGSMEQLELPELPQGERIRIGETYAAEELIKKMIKTSSNVAMYLLSRNLNQNDIKKVYEDLDITGPFLVKDDFMSIKNYSFFFRVLFNTTYLTREYSEQALDLLTHTEFNQGLTANIPPGITVAHKFGSHVHENTSPTLGELHDCGIIYYPEHPYFLCVMTTGYSSDAAQNTIADISATIYNAVDNFFRK